MGDSGSEGADTTQRGSLEMHLPTGEFVTAEISGVEVAYPQGYKQPPEPDKLPFTSIIDDLPFNEAPDNPGFVSRKWKWWPELKAPTGITIHHTLSHSPLETAKYCAGPYRLNAGGQMLAKGYPTIQYHLWVSADTGCPVWQCVPFDDAIWHDHTGVHQTTISVGMAGHLHDHAPPEAQIQAAAVVVHWLMDTYRIPIEEVQGHCERAKRYGVETLCPGWYWSNWRGDFYDALKSAC